MNAQQKQLAALPANDHYDTLTLAAKQLSHAEALFKAIHQEAERDNPDPGHLKRLAGLGEYLSDMAAGDFETEARALGHHPINSREAAS